MDVSKVAVIGAGVMGSGIAQVLAVAGCEVVCCDVAEEQLERARRLTADGRYGLARAVERGKLSAAQAASAGDRLRFSADADAAVAAADLVVEAVPEDLDLKVRLFARFDQLAAEHTILATNTSGLPVTAMAAATARPAKVIGWHWSSPAPVMRMAEIVITPDTGDETVATVVDLARRCGKNPVVVRDNPAKWGHVGNRIYAAAVAEARAVVAEGLTDEAGVDQIMTDGWGWPAGPFGMGRGARRGWQDAGGS